MARVKCFIYCLLRDGKYFAFYTYNNGSGNKTGFSSKYCTPYMTPVLVNSSWGKASLDKKDYTKSAYHPHSNSFGAIAKSIFHQIKQPGDRFVIHRVNSKKCPFDVHFLPTTIKNKKSKLFPITPKV